MIRQKKVYSLKKAINLFMVIALVMAGVAVNVSPVSAQAGVVIDSPTHESPAFVKSGAALDVEFTVSGLTGAGQYRIQLGSTNFGPYDYTFTAVAEVTQSIIIPSLADNAYDLKVEAKLDTQTEWTSDLEFGAVIVDNTLPVTPKLTAPNGGEYISNSGNFTITWDATKISDAHLAENPISLQYSANGGANWMVIAPELADVEPGEYVWIVPDIITTQALVKIIVIDLAGNTSADQSDSVFTIYGADNTPPEVAMVNPVATGTPYIGGTVELAATASDVQSGISSVVFQYSAAVGGPWTTAGVGELSSGVYVFDFDTTPLTDGAIYYFRAVATNGAGASTASTPVDAKIENTPPAMTLLKPAADNDWLKEDYEFVVEASDAQSGIFRLDIYQFVGGAYQTSALCSDTTPGTPVGGVYTLSCTETPNETATKIKAVVTNGAGKTSMVERAVQVDITDPVLPVDMLITPANSAVLQLGTNTNISWKTTGISDDHLAPNPIRLELRRGSTKVADIASALPLTPGSYTWTVAGIPPATDYQVCVVVSDLAGNTAEDCNSPITIWGTDATAPTVDLASIASPNKGDIVLSAAAADPESGIQKVEFFYKKVGDPAYTLIYSDISAPYTATWNSAGVNGEVLFKAVATNGVGTVAEEIFGPVLIDNTLPVVGDVSPAAGNLAGSVIFSAPVTDVPSGIASVVFEYGLEVEGEWVFAPIGAGTYNAGTGKYDSPAWDTTAFADGTEVQIKVIASDHAGNQAIRTTGEYTINNAPPEYTFNLVAGWNLISLPLIPDDPAIETFLSELIANESVIQVVAWPYDLAEGKIIEKRWNGANLQDVTEMVDGVGYWVEMSKPDVLTFTGDYLPEPPAAPPSYIVYSGWNLIGFLSMDNVEAEVYLGEAGVGNMRAMYDFNESTGYYEQITLDDPLNPGNGYWLAVSVDATIYPYGESADS